MPGGFLSLLFCLLQQQNTKKNWYVPNTEKLVSRGQRAQTQDSRVRHSKWKALQQNSAQQSWRKHHFQVLEKLPQKKCFWFKPSQHQTFIVSWEPKPPNYLRSALRRHWPWTADGEFCPQLQELRSAATPAEPDTCKTALSLLGRTQISALAHEHRNTLSPSLNQGSEGFHTRCLILPVSGTLRSITARAFTAACLKILRCPSPRQL